jgi:two-component system, NtrC family, response regulator HydG
MSSPLRILVVDDDHDHAESLAEVFALEGHETRVVNSGEEAILAYETDNFDIAFIDVMMPGKNGVESFLEIKRQKPDARVYMMSGFSVEQVLEQAMDNGAMGVLIKPVEPPQVLASLARVQPEGIVLVAEDDPEFVDRLHRAIETAGHRCKLVKRPSSALAAHDGAAPDVLIFDLHAPLMRGIELYADLRRRGRARPTVLVTSAGDRHVTTIDALTDIELTGILHKPFDPAALVEKLYRLAS